MRIPGAVLAAVAALLAPPAILPSAGASTFDAAASVAEAAPACLEAAAPCGWINPLIILDFPDKPKCGAGQAGGTVDRSDCLALPAVGDAVVLEGTLVWYWDVSAEGIYPNDPLQDITISFSGTASNPSALAFTMEPDAFSISTADLFSPAYFRPDADDPAQARIFYWYEKPLTLTVTRTAPLSAEDAGRAEARDGLLPFFVKARSTESSDRFKAAFGVEEVRFDASGDPAVASPGNEAPGLGAAAGLAAIAAAAVTSRGRGSAPRRRGP